MSIHGMRGQQDLADSLGISLAELNRNLPCYSPRCDGHFLLRINRKSGDVFFGCSRYPDCKATRSADDVSDELTCTVIGEGGDPNEPHYGE